ncbi:hypothetical protein [Helcococcus kunzii]|uniref:hypothetical protein n=1 Tax=Helcococcus kunzii TaxID=40091 RepID=UPI0038AE4EFA
MKIEAKHWENGNLRVFCKKDGYKIGDTINNSDYMYFILIESKMHYQETGSVDPVHFHEWLMKKYNEVEND